MKRILLSALIAFGMHQAKAQVTEINSNQSLKIQFPIPNSDKGILISDVDSTVWVTDGTALGTKKLSSGIRFSEGAGVLNNKVLFVGKTAANGKELFITDGTIAGTKIVKDIVTGTEGSDPDDFTKHNGVVYFTASTSATTRELWKTDGTAGGTIVVKTLFTGTGAKATAGDYNLFSSGSYMLLSVKNGQGNELWKSDGTSAGTAILKDINPGTGSSDPKLFFNYNNIVLFSANNGTNGVELWKTDGTTGGTVMVKDINQGPGDAFTFLFFRVLNGKAYFIANNGINGDEIWSTDGTLGNTSMLKDINPGPLGSFASIYLAVPIGNKFYFTAMSASNGAEIWVSDGTLNGTTIFKDIVAGTDGSNPFIYTPYEFDYSAGTFTVPLFQGNKFFFMATTPGNGSELWVCDGTVDGTKIVKDIIQGPDDGITSPSFMYTSTGLYFAAGTAATGSEIWKSDGTLGGTVPVADINVGIDESEATFGMIVNNKLVFEANNGDNSASDLYVVNASLSTLPVTLTDFTAAAKNGDALLQWSTATEINTKEFIVERSTDGNSFIAVGSVKATELSTEKHNYNYVDPGVVNLKSEKVYYRLLIKDNDGKSSYSKVAVLDVKGLKGSIRIVQNPVKDQVHLSLKDVNGDVKISVVDMNGRIAYTVKTSVRSNMIIVPVAELQAGTYTLVAETNEGRFASKFVKN